MTQEPSFFRPEALQHWADRKGPGSLLRASSRWLEIAFWAVVAVFVAGAVLSWNVHVDIYAFGPVTRDAEDLVARFPDLPAGGVPQGASVDVRAPDGTWVRGLAVSGSSGNSVSLVGRPTLAGGTARVRVGSEPLLAAFVPGVRTIVGRRP